MIPKKIHYCWFGGNPLPKSAKKYIKSWKKYCPDYEIICWDESSFDVFSAPLYVRQAYEAKKWAFVTDYVRLYALFYHGGIYMDTDVEVIKSLDRFLIHQAFSGFESIEYIPTGIMASEKGHATIGKLMEYYDTHEFIVNGKPDTTTNCAIITKEFSKNGLILNDQYQEVMDVALYPHDYFCPKSWDGAALQVTDHTYTIHHFAGSWWSADMQKRKKNELKRMKRQNRIHFIKHIPNLALMGILGKNRYNRLKQRIKRD